MEEPPLSDEELAYRAASGERAAFQRLHERTDTIHVGHRPLGVAVADGLVWVTLRA